MEVPNKLPNNKYNSVLLEEGQIVKRGPSRLLEGEIYFYNALQHVPSLQRFFPAFYGASEGSGGSSGRAMLRLEYIRGLPAYTLFKSQSLTAAHVESLFDVLDRLHATPPSHDTILLSASEIEAAYAEKLEERFSVADDYDFEGSPALQTKIREVARALPPPEPVAFIHGDYWLSNLMFDDGGVVKALDMRGRIGSVKTTCGDKYYDYAKLYQSFLGYDAVLYGDSIDNTYKTSMQSLFEAQVLRRGLDMTHIRDLCYVLMASSFGFMGYDEGRKARMGAWLLGLLGA